MKKNIVLMAIATLLFSIGMVSYAALMRNPSSQSTISQVRKAATDMEDITEKYIVNSSFENDDIKTLQSVVQSADGLRGYQLNTPTGWNVSGTSVTQLLVATDCFTDNNFGKVTTIPDGSYAYYLRQGWSDGTTTLKQTIKNLPKGRYKLTVYNRSGYANSATSSFKLFADGSNASFAFTQGSQGFMTTLAWTVSELIFETTSDGNIDLGMEMNWVSGGSCVMFDNVRLYRLSDEYVEPEEPTEADVESFTEGVINNTFVDEETMKADLLQMLANFTTYLVNDFQECSSPNSINEACGCFRGENTMGNNEQGVRPNADLSMICAFLVKYGQGKVNLPAGVTWNKIEDMAMKSLVFAYSTHKANKLKVCSGNNYWGSTSTSDYAWESSLWAMSVAYSAFFQWDKLSDSQKNYIKNLLKAECNYELNRSIPTGYNGDTKSEENGWEADILAATLGLFPDDALASKWFNRLREFAINSYSHADDAKDNTVIDPDYDNKTVANLYKGQNLYSDYTLQNHNYFHTSYQNVVMQELGEAALALKLFQNGIHGKEKWKTNALMHNNLKVQQEVLNWLALADGELAMPNGNDWSLFLFDQITSYSTNACFLQDADALMLENLAYKFIKARQKTTKDGSWLLRADVGARRMGVEAHRVMMTWLMHEVMSTSALTPTNWDDFTNKYSEAKLFTTQNVVRAATKDRFTTFSWSTGLKSYTGYIAANSVDKNKIIVPFRANNTGNILGWYEVSGKGTNATPVVSGIYNLQGNSYTMNGELNTNDATLNNRFAIYSTSGNAVIYIDYVRANNAGTISSEKGGLTAISVDEFTKTKRTLYTEGTHKQLDGATFTTMEGNWVNVDNAVGIIGQNNKKIAFGDKSNNNSINTAKLYPMYSSTSRSFKSGDVVDRRNLVYYSNISAEQTQAMNEQLQVLTEKVPMGWNGVIAADPDGTNHLLLSNFASAEKCVLSNITCTKGAPVFSTETTINDSQSSAEFIVEENHSIGNTLKFFIQGNNIKAIQEKDNADVVYIEANQNTTITINAVEDGNTLTKTTNLTVGKPIKCIIETYDLKVVNSMFPENKDEELTKGYENVTSSYLSNPNFEQDETYGASGKNITSNGATYENCFINQVNAINAKWPNILPVQGWTNGHTMSGGSNYCRMYSMPYSSTLYCVSPSNVGNYAAKTTGMMSDETKGERVLTVLNSWDKGSNCIKQTINLPAGTYRLLLDMKYECPNETSNNGTSINTSGGNVNSSLTGISYGNTKDYRYPTTANSWEQMYYDITLEKATDVTISLGYSSSASVGAANNTLLYIDNVRLYKKAEPHTKYLFAYFPSNDNENIYYALSDNGFDYTPMNDGNMMISSDTTSIKKGLRDPHLIRGNDGYFYMVATDMKSAEGWASNRGMVLMKSKDLVNWQHSTVHFPEKYAGTNFANVTRVWAPETIWDPEAGKYMIYFSLLTNDGTIPYDKAFYCYANEDFTDLEGEPTLLFDLGYSVIDMDIVYNDADGLYHGFFKNEDKGGILKVTSKTLTAPEGAALGSQWGNMSGRLQQTNVAVEGAGVFKLLDGKTWVLMYDCYSRGYYQFCTSTDLNTFTFKQNTTTSGMFTPRHGSVITLTDAEVATINNAIAQKAHARIQAELEEEIRNALALGIDVKEAMALANDPMASNEALTDMTQQLKVAEYAAVESTYTEDVTTTYLGTWRESGGTNNANKGQHWDGTSTSTYMEQSGNNWGRSSWSIAYQQDVKLPAGSYVLKVAGRSSSSVVASMNVNGQSVSFPAKGDTGYGISIDGKTNFSPDATYANNNNGRGWEWRYIPFEVKENGTINISLLAEASSTHQWVSFANVSLLHKVPSKIHAMEVFEEGANLYNLQGQRIGSPLSTIPQKSIVIKNHKKFVSR